MPINGAEADTMKFLAMETAAPSLPLPSSGALLGHERTVQPMDLGSMGC